MTCITPPALTDAVLLRYLDGEADVNVNNHLQACEYCRARSQELARIEVTFMHALHRIECPSAEELGEFHLEMLSRGRLNTIGAHLKICPHCTNEIAKLESFLGLVRSDIFESDSSRLEVWIAEKVSILGDIFTATPELTPALLTTRGGEEYTQVFTAGKAQIAIKTQVDARDSTMRTLVVLVSGIKSTSCEVQLLREGEPLQVVHIDPATPFTLDSLVEGQYGLIFTCQQVQIRIEKFEIN